MAGPPVTPAEYCGWNPLFSDQERRSTVNGVKLFVLTCASFTLYFYAFHPIPDMKLLLVNNQNTCIRESYKHLNYFFAAIHIRNILTFFAHEDLVQWIVKKMFNECGFFAFWDTFLNVFEVEILTHACIERYVVAKYITNEWKIQKKHYSVYFYLSVFFAVLYSTPPLYNVGSYTYDFTCTSCTFDVVLPEDWRRYAIVTIFVLRSIKPALVMIVMLYWARSLESKFDSTKKKTADSYFTKVVIAITSLNLVCWAPIALVKGSVILSQLHHEQILVPPPTVIQWAIWINEIRSVLTMLARVIIDCMAHFKIFFVPIQDDVDDKEFDNDSMLSIELAKNKT